MNIEILRQELKDNPVEAGETREIRLIKMIGELTVQMYDLHRRVEILERSRRRAEQ